VLHPGIGRGPPQQAGGFGSLTKSHWLQRPVPATPSTWPPTPSLHPHIPNTCNAAPQLNEDSRIMLSLASRLLASHYTQVTHATIRRSTPCLPPPLDPL
jgi:hypothetical protein